MSSFWDRWKISFKKDLIEQVQTTTEAVQLTNPLPNDNPFSRYKITDEGLQGLVNGKLVCESTEERGKFFVKYDSIVWDPSNRLMKFCWCEIVVMQLECPAVIVGDTLTVKGLVGKLPLEIGI